MPQRSPESIKRTQELRRQAKKGRSVKDGTFKPYERKLEKDFKKKATPVLDRKRYKKGGDVEKENKQFKAFKEKDDAEQKRRKRKAEIKKIMQDPTSRERIIYDKMLKGKFGYPDLDKVDEKGKKTRKMNKGGMVIVDRNYLKGR